MKRILNKIWCFAIRNKAYILAFFIPAAILYIAYAVFGVYPFGERSVLALDLNAQYVSYFEYMYDVFAGKESIFYCWSRSFSGEFLGLFAYYLASPFNFIVWAFPRELITEGLLTMILVKAAASGLAMAFLLKGKRRFSDYTTVLFSIMYALSGYFTAHSINPMWLDGMIALPFIIIGVELACDKRKILPYVIPLLYIFYANYYIGYMTGIFSALYFLYYLLSGKSEVKNWAERAKAIAVYGFSSVAAILMSCPIVIPVIKSLQLGKMDNPNPDFSLHENFNLVDMLLKLFPATYDTIRPEGMPMIYCGTLALVFAIVYFAVGKAPLRAKISGGVLIGIIAVSMFIKPVDMIWHGGQVPVWMPYRYCFTLVFLLIVFGAEAFEQRNGVSAKTLGVIFASLMALLVFCDYTNDKELIVVIPMIFLALIMTVSAANVLSKGNRNQSAISAFLLAMAVGMELFVNAEDTFERAHKDIWYSSRDSYVDDIPKSRAVADEIKEMDDGFYRMEKTYHRTVNDPLSIGLYGVSHSTSTYNIKVIRLMRKLGYGARDHYTRYDGATLLTDDIFGIKYVLSKDDRTVPYENPVLTEGEISVFENEDALPIAYLADLDIIGSRPDSTSPFAAQETLARALSGGVEKLYYPIFDFTFDCQNINIGSTTDGHSSYKKRVESEDAFVSYNVTMPHSGAAYMYLPTNYERECALYLNDVYLKNYFENENHSIVYLGDYNEGESFNVRLNLYNDAMYVEEPEFVYLDREDLRTFNETLSEKNADTVLVKTSPTSLELSVNAAEDCALFASIPLEDGWTVEIDGEEAEILPAVDDTFMCVRVPAGSHKITLKFFTAGLVPGLILGGAGLAVLVLLIFGMRILEKTPPAATDIVKMEDDHDNGEL